MVSVMTRPASVEALAAWTAEATSSREAPAASATFAHCAATSCPKPTPSLTELAEDAASRGNLHRNGHCHWISRPSYSARSSGRAPLLPRLYRTAAAANEREERRGRNETKELGFFDLYSNPSVSQPSVLI